MNGGIVSGRKVHRDFTGRRCPGTSRTTYDWLPTYYAHSPPLRVEHKLRSIFADTEVAVENLSGGLKIKKYRMTAVQWSLEWAQP